MIKLTKVDGRAIAVNEDFIENIASAPDTIITMQSGRAFVVKENMEEIILLIKQFKKSCISDTN